MRFVLEHSVSPRLAAMLAAFEGEAGETVVHLRHFDVPQGTRDEIRIPGLARLAPDAIVITADVRIIRSPHTREAWRAAGLTFFFLKGYADLDFDVQAWKLVQWWPEIRRAAARCARGSSFTIGPRSGKVEPLP